MDLTDRNVLTNIQAGWIEKLWYHFAEGEDLKPEDEKYGDGFKSIGIYENILDKKNVKVWAQDLGIGTALCSQSDNPQLKEYMNNINKMFSCIPGSFYCDWISIGINKELLSELDKYVNFFEVDAKTKIWLDIDKKHSELSYGKVLTKMYNKLNNIREPEPMMYL